MNCEPVVQNYSKGKVNIYKEQEIVSSSPEKCVLHLYDIAIQSCAQKEETQAGKALASLIDSLDYQSGGEIASRLFSLYEYCLKTIHSREFENPIKILKELRKTWQTAMKSYKAA